jgi:hypothetical protein
MDDDRIDTRETSKEVGHISTEKERSRRTEMGRDKCGKIGRSRDNEQLRTKQRGADPM